MSFKKKLRVTPSKVLMYWDNYWAIMMNHHNLFEFFFFLGFKLYKNNNFFGFWIFNIFFYDLF